MRVGLRLGLLLPAKFLSTSAKLIGPVELRVRLPHWPYRMGGLSDEQRAAMAERARTNLRRPRAALNDSHLPSAMKRGADRRRAGVIRMHVATDPPTLVDLSTPAEAKAASADLEAASRGAQRSAASPFRDLTTN
jgi:hypothetical protein